MHPAAGAAPGAGVGADPPAPALAGPRPGAGPTADGAALPPAGAAAAALPAGVRPEAATTDGPGAPDAALSAPDWGEVAGAVPGAGTDEPSPTGIWAAGAGMAGAPAAGAADDSLALSSARRS